MTNLFSSDKEVGVLGVLEKIKKAEEKMSNLGFRKVEGEEVEFPKFLVEFQAKKIYYLGGKFE